MAAGFVLRSETEFCLQFYNFTVLQYCNIVKYLALEIRDTAEPSLPAPCTERNTQSVLRVYENQSG
ncbi:MAG: hypothetical protein RR215_05640, partial [Ruthenibacterium sp.]